MSTGYGHFTSRDGKPVYVDASQIGDRISLCGKNDADVYFDLGPDEAFDLISALKTAYFHNGWEWPE